MSRLPKGDEEETVNPLGSGWEAINLEGEELQEFKQTAKDPFSPPIPEAPKSAQRLVYLFDPKEASAVFLLLPAPKEPLTGISCQPFRVQPLPFPFDEGVRIKLLA